MKSRRDFLIGGAAAVAAASLPWIRRPPRRPNLLFILADDLGYGDLSSFGRRDFRTPNLDAMAAGGVRFTRAYSAASVCTPTRAGFMTGRYPARLPAGLQQPMSWVNERDGLPPDHPTIASLLKPAGYQTSLIGKWHLGYLPQFGPLHHGFDEFFGILSGGVDYYTHRDAVAKPDLHEGLVPVERVGYLTDVLTDRAVEYVSRQRTGPFFLSLQYTAPHWPWQSPDHQALDTAGKGFDGGGSPDVFREMVQRLDQGVGRVMNALGMAGIDRDTLVVFTSDNGGERYSFNWPHQQSKGTLWEGGIRVPSILRWPGVVPAGGVSEQVAITMDWTATLLAAAGVTPAPSHPLDGVDLLTVAKGDRPAFERTLFWRQPSLRYNGQPPQRAARRGQWKFLAVGDKTHLFNLATDPGEHWNRERRHSDTASDLEEALARWNSELPALEQPAGTSGR